jgi:HEAT repeat protein
VPSLIATATKEPQEAAYSEALAQIGAPAIQPLLDHFSATEASGSSREWIFRALRGMGAPALDTLAKSLQSPSPAVRAGAATALADMSVESPAIVKALLAMTDDPSPPIRAAALRAISGVRSEKEVAAAKLEQALGHADPLVRKAGAAGLARMGAGAKLGLDGLMNLLDDPDLTTQRSAIQALGGMGAAAAKAAPTVLQRVEVPELRLVSLEALGKFGPAAEAAIPRLKTLAGEGPSEMRYAAIEALNGIGPAAQEALPVLYDVLQNHEERDVRIQALKALLKIEQSDDKLLPVALKIFDESIGSLHREAAIALRRFGDRAQPALPGLLDMLSRENDRGEALGTLRGMRVQAVQPLMKKLDDKAPEVRVFACEALAKLGAEAREALPALQQRVEKEGDPVRSAAQKAIEQIGKPG